MIPYDMLTLFAVCVFGMFAWLSHARLQRQLFYNEVRLMIGVTEILASVTAVSDAFNTFLADQTPVTSVDLQPVADALDTLKAKIVAATPTPASPFNADGTVR